jgi:hypothetical protein
MVTDVSSVEDGAAVGREKFLDIVPRSTLLGDVHLVVGHRTQAGRKRADRHDLALDVSHSHPFALAQHPPEGQDESARRLGHEPGRSQGEHHSDEDAQTLEGVAAGAGQIRVGHGQREEPHERDGESSRQTDRVAIDPGQFVTTGLHAERHGLQDLGAGVGQGADHGDHDQARHGVDESVRDVGRYAAHITGEALGPRAGCTGSGRRRTAATPRPGRQ